MRVTIYGRTEPKCVWCDRAKRLAVDKGLEMVFNDIVDPMVKADLLSRVPGVKTVPQIFVDNTHVGGYEDFENYIMEKNYD